MSSLPLVMSSSSMSSCMVLVIVALLLALGRENAWWPWTEEWFSKLAEQMHIRKKWKKGRFSVCYYHPNWGGHKKQGLVKPFTANDLPIDYINEIAHAFVGLEGSDSKGYAILQLDTQADAKEFEAYKALKLKKPSLKICLAVGGWNHSFNFSSMCRTKANRSSFIRSLKTFVDKHSFFSGCYIDWEYPSDKGNNYGRNTVYTQYNCRPLPVNESKKGDGEKLLELVKEMRAAFPRPFHLGMCTSVDTSKLDWNVKEVAKHLDVLQVMSYDILGGWEQTVTGHHANLHPWKGSRHSASGTVDYLIGLGVPPSKIAIGIAMYSRGAKGNDTHSAMLGERNVGPSPDWSWQCPSNAECTDHKGCERGSLDYAHCPPSGSTEYWDDQAKAHYAYDATRKVFTSYDSPESVRAKCEYVKRKGLWGTFAWETTQDKPIGDSKCLTRVLYENLEAA